MPSSNKPAVTQTTQTRSPWAPSQGNLQTVLTNAGNLAGDVGNFTPTFSNSTMAGIQGLETAANAGPGAASAALGQIVPGSTAGFNTGMGQLSQVAGGSFLNANPYLDAALNAGRDAVTNRVNSTFAGAGRYGSAAHTGALTRGLGELEIQARMANYGQERGAQDAAARALYAGGFQGAGMGGALDAANLQPAQLNLQAGALRDQQAAAQQRAPLVANEWLASMTNPIAGLGGTTNGTQTTTQPTNRMSQIMGGVQMGLGLLTGNPMMMLGGAGGLMGAMGGGGGGGSGSYTAPPTNLGSWGNLVGGV